MSLFEYGNEKFVYANFEVCHAIFEILADARSLSNHLNLYFYEKNEVSINDSCLSFTRWTILASLITSFGLHPLTILIID